MSFEERMERDQAQRRLKQLELQKESEEKIKKDFQFTPKISKMSQKLAENRMKSPIFDRLYEKKKVPTPDYRDGKTGQKLFHPQINSNPNNNSGINNNNSYSITTSGTQRTEILYEEALHKQVRQQTVQELIEKTDEKKRNAKRISRESELILKKKMKTEIENEFERYDKERIGCLNKEDILNIIEVYIYYIFYIFY